MGDLNLQNHVDYPDILVVIGYLMTFSLAGSVGNAFVIYIFSRKREKSTTTVFILVLAMTDFFTCLVIIPFTIYYEVMEKRVNSNVQCKVYMFLITTNIPFSAFIMVLIAFDRSNTTVFFQFLALNYSIEFWNHSGRAQIYLKWLSPI